MAVENSKVKKLSSYLSDYLSGRDCVFCLNSAPSVPKYITEDSVGDITKNDNARSNEYAQGEITRLDSGKDSRAHSGLTTHNCCSTCLELMPRIIKACNRCSSILEYSLMNGEPHRLGEGYYEDSDGFLCPSCYHSPPPVDYAWTPYVYFHPLNRAIHKLKYNRMIHYANPLGYLWQHAYQRTMPHMLSKHQVDLIIPMPLHRKRHSDRGFNQSLEMIKPLAKIIDIPISQGKNTACIRSKSTMEQKDLSIKERQKNLKDSFMIRDPENVRGKSILIVDDVITTATSVNELASSLKEAGAKKVFATALTRAPAI